MSVWAYSSTQARCGQSTLQVDLGHLPAQRRGGLIAFGLETATDSTTEHRPSTHTHAVDVKTRTPIHTLVLTQQTFSLSVIPVFPGAPSKPSPRFVPRPPAGDGREHTLRRMMLRHYVPFAALLNVGQRKGGTWRRVQLLLMICFHASCGHDCFGGSLACEGAAPSLAKAEKANLPRHCSDTVSAGPDLAWWVVSYKDRRDVNENNLRRMTLYLDSFD